MSKLIFLIASLFLIQTFANATKPRKHKIRVASYNIEFFKEANAEEIARMLHANRIDVIALQEVPDKTGYQSAKDLQNALNTIEQRLKTGITWSGYTGKIGSGNDDRKFKSILSNTALSDTAELDLVAQNGRHGASAVRATIKVSGMKVSVYSLHTPGASYYKKNLVDHSELKNDLSKVVIVMGDFNETLHVHGFDELMKAAGFLSIWQLLNIDVTKEKTWDATGKEPDEGVIDHIYLRGKNIRVIDGGIIKLDKALSDHCPIWAELLISIVK